MLEIWAVVGILFVTWCVLVSFFTPRIDYRISAPPRLNSDEFLCSSWSRRWCSV